MTQSVIMGKLYSEANVMVKTATEFFLGGQARVDVASNKMDYQAPQGGVGGVWGGVLRGGTLRLVPMENNPTDASRAGMDAGAAQVPFLDAGARLATGTTAGGHEASRGEAALELGLQVGLVAAGTKLQSLNVEGKVASKNVAKIEAGAVGEAVTPKGSLKITAIKPSESEVRAANFMKDKGAKVELRDPEGTRAGGKTSDLLVNDVAYDVYTPTSANPDRIISAIAKKNTQAEGIVLDLSNTTVTKSQLGNALSRVQGAGAKNIKDIQIIGDK